MLFKKYLKILLFEHLRKILVFCMSLLWKIVEIQTRMWKLWLVKNHKWMKTFHPILDENFSSNFG